MKLLTDESIQDLYKRRLRFYTHIEELKEGIEEEWHCIKELLQKTEKEVLGAKKPGRKNKGLNIFGNTKTSERKKRSVLEIS